MNRKLFNVIVPRLTVIIILLLVSATYAAWDKAKPAGSTPLKTADDQIRANNDAIEAALDQDHDFTTGSTQTGKHQQVTFKAPLGTKPSLAADEGAVYTKTVSTKSELHFEDEDGTEVQLTSGGKINAIRGSAKAVLRVINVNMIWPGSGSDVRITITSIWNGDTLTATDVAGTSTYYDFNVTGNCLAVLGCFMTSAKYDCQLAKPFGAVVSNNLRIYLDPDTDTGTYNIPFSTFLNAVDDGIDITIAYLTDA